MNNLSTLTINTSALFGMEESVIVGWDMGASQSQQSEENDIRRKQQNYRTTDAKAAEKAAEAKPFQTQGAMPVEKAKQELMKLPHNLEAILNEANALADRSSSDKLLAQLHQGVLLDKKKKKYWVDEKSNKNSFFLFAKALSITWGEDERYWHWTTLKETTSETFIDVAELLNVCWLEVHGKFETTKLSPGTLYEVLFVIMLKDPAYGWEAPVNLRLTLPNGEKHERKENLMAKPRGQWIEIPLGEFRTSSEDAGEIEFYLYEHEDGEWKRGLLIKGVTIRPKTNIFSK